VMTGLGRLGYDKRIGSEVHYRPMDVNEVEDLYASDDAAARIADELPNEAFREGFEVEHEGDDSLDGPIKEMLKTLEVSSKFTQAWIWARMYGGAAIIPITDDVQNLSLPLDEGRIFEIKSFLVLSRYELFWSDLERDVRSPNFGLPTTYMIQPRGISTDVNSVHVHSSRVIRFDGNPLPRGLFVRNNYWGGSVYDRTYNAIRNYNISHDAAATALQDFSVSVYKLKDLADIIAEGGADKVLARMQLVNASRSIARAVMVDADTESYETQNRSLAGVKEMLEKVDDRLVAASGMPHTKMLGQSPSGLGATGRSEETDWYNFVRAQQVGYAEPRLMQMIKLCMLQRKGPTAGKIPKEMAIHWKPLWQMDDKERAEVRYLHAQADEKYIMNSVFDPTEVRATRSGDTRDTYDAITVDKEMPTKTPEDQGAGDAGSVPGDKSGTGGAGKPPAEKAPAPDDKGKK
jgi:phage-related protein (TIGR01555 family)